jgi:hypothetical protein
MGRLIYIPIGTKIGNWTVISNSFKKPVGKTECYFYRCKCVCGKERDIRKSSLTSGGTSSCQEGACNNNYVDGNSFHDLGNQWKSMLGRCYDANHISYKFYGAKGIIVCDRWFSFENFIADVGERPSRGMQIDRIDNEGNYCPENTRWTTSSENNRNKSNNKMLIYNGISKCLAEWCDDLDFSYSTVHNRIHRLGWSVREAFEKPLEKR